MAEPLCESVKNVHFCKEYYWKAYLTVLKGCASALCDLGVV